MMDTTAPAATGQSPEHCLLAEGGREYLFSRCSSCDSMHKRQEVLWISNTDLQKWKDAGRYPNMWGALLSAWPLWMFVIFMLSVDGDFHPKFGWTITALTWAIGGALGITGYRSNGLHSERKTTIREEVLEKYGAHVLLEEVDTLESLKQSDWESEPDDDKGVKYAVAVKK